MNQNYERLYIGLDVGSTTVKAVVVDPVKDEILWQDYQRHETKQPEKVLEFLGRIEAEFPISTRERPHIRHRFGRRRPGAFDRREIRAGGQCRLACGREALSRSRIGHRTGRPGRKDHHLQGRP